MDQKIGYLPKGTITTAMVVKINDTKSARMGLYSTILNIAVVTNTDLGKSFASRGFFGIMLTERHGSTLVKIGDIVEVKIVSYRQSDFGGESHTAAECSFIRVLSKIAPLIDAPEPADHIKDKDGALNVEATEQPHYEEIVDNDLRLEIGKWSEKYVFDNLAKWGFAEIVWENEIEESGKPYDFKAKENGKEKFIEVKGTPSSKKDIVYLSSGEWNLMTQQNDSYILIRVYNARKSNVSQVIIRNPRQQIERGTVQVALRV